MSHRFQRRPRGVASGNARQPRPGRAGRCCNRSADAYDTASLRRHPARRPSRDPAPSSVTHRRSSRGLRRLTSTRGSTDSRATSNGQRTIGLEPGSGRGGENAPTEIDREIAGRSVMRRKLDEVSEAERARWRGDAGVRGVQHRRRLRPPARASRPRASAASAAAPSGRPPALTRQRAPSRSPSRSPTRAARRRRRSRSSTASSLP